MNDDSYKSLQVFEGSINKWPTFLLKFRTMLESKDLLYIIDRKDDSFGLVNESADEKATRIDQGKSRVKNDAKVRSLFINKLSEDAISLVEDLTTAFDMVQRLVSQYQSTSAASVISRLDKLLDISYKQGSEMSSHIGSINALINQIKKAGGLDLDKLHMVILLRSMPKVDNWNVLVTSLKSKEEKDLNKDMIIKSLTEMADEFARDKSAASQPIRSQKNAAFNANAGSFMKNKENVKCFRCGKLGHFKKDCRVKLDASQGERDQKSPRRSGNPSEPKGNYAFVDIKHTTRIEQSKHTEWLKYSGASKHYTWDKGAIRNLKHVDDQLKVGNGATVKILGVGEVVFKATTSTGKTSYITLKEVYYAPDMCVNLISTSELDSKGIIEISAQGVTRFMVDDNEVMCARKSSSKWIMDMEVITHDANTTLGGSNNDIWHRRLCHLGFQNLQKHSKLVDGMEIAGGSQDHICDICVQAKMTRRTFKSSKGPRAKHPMDIIHMDVNVINIEGRGGEKYLLMLTDDNSGCRFGFPMKTKSGAEILEHVTNWLPWAERMTDRRLKAVRHDNAKEFCEGTFATAMRGMGVEMQLSVAYEHEQNGMAENSNRVILDKSRSILLESGLDRKFWPDAINTAVFASNRSPHRGSDVIPIERFTSNRVDVGNLRIFGAWCWRRVPTEKLQGRNKFEPRGILCRFLGYENGGHAYRLIEWSSGKIVIGTNVRFDEMATSNPE